MQILWEASASKSAIEEKTFVDEVFERWDVEGWEAVSWCI